MKIGVLSDTHLIEPNTRFKKVIEFHFKDAEEILHAGDFVDGSVAEYFSSLIELVVVCGNMHSEEKRMAADGRGALGILRLDQDIEGEIVQIKIALIFYRGEGSVPPPVMVHRVKSIS